MLHDLDVAHELRIDPASQLADPAFVERQARSLANLLEPRLTFYVDGVAVPWTMTSVSPVAGKEAVEMMWRAPSGRTAGKVTIAADLFPYDPNHQTFINVYEGGELVRQEILNSGKTSVDLYSGSRQGLFAVFKAFTASGIHHIAIGPDHILFIIGLLLLGGSLGRLLTIVTAFTIGHSITLALATLQIVDPPARIIEPAIALSIVFVGADNLLSDGKGRDVRAWVALAFGLVHGFGFASVLRETGLPDARAGRVAFLLQPWRRDRTSDHRCHRRLGAGCHQAARRRARQADCHGRVGRRYDCRGLLVLRTGLLRGRDTMRRMIVLGLLVAAGAVTISATQAPEQKPNVAEIEKVRDNLFMIKGGGGNTAAFVTAHGVVLVDTKTPTGDRRSWTRSGP